MNVYEVILKRRSIRAFRKDKLDNEAIYKILNVARWAPSAGNRQPWHFIVVLNEELKEKLVPICRNQKFIAEASCIIVGLADVEKSPKWAIVDTTIALEHMALEACEMGLGSCWIGAFNEDEIKELLRIPEKYKVVALLPIGYPAETPQPRSRRNIHEIYSINTFDNEEKFNFKQ